MPSQIFRWWVTWQSSLTFCFLSYIIATLPLNNALHDWKLCWILAGNHSQRFLSFFSFPLKPLFAVGSPKSESDFSQPQFNVRNTKGKICVEGNGRREREKEKDREWKKERKKDENVTLEKHLLKNWTAYKLVDKFVFHIWGH